MTFAEAKNYKMPFGKHKGKTIDEIAESDEGLKYLDWLNGEISPECNPTGTALQVYMSDESIKKEISKIL